MLNKGSVFEDSALTRHPARVFGATCMRGRPVFRPLLVVGTVFDEFTAGTFCEFGQIYKSEFMKTALSPK